MSVFRFEKMTYDEFIEIIKTEKIDFKFLLDLCMFNHSEHRLNILKYIINKKLVNVHQQTNYGTTILHVICMGGADDEIESNNLLNVLEYIIDEKILDITLRNDYGNNFLQSLFKYCNNKMCILNVVKYMTNISPTNIDVLRVFNNVDTMGCCVLHLIFYGVNDICNFDIFKCIIENRVIDVNSVNYNGNNFLHMLFYSNGLYYTSGPIHILNVLEYVIKNNIIDIRNCNNDGKNILHILCSNSGSKLLPNVLEYIVNTKSYVQNIFGDMIDDRIINFCIKNSYSAKIIDKLKQIKKEQKDSILCVL